MNLKDIRKQIGRIDYEIILRLSERMELALRTKRLKPEITDQEQEKTVLKSAGKYSIGLVEEKFAKEMFREILKESKRLQKKNLKMIGFQGEHGAYSEVAAKNNNEKFVPIPCLEFADVFEGIEDENFDMGILPVENSLEGSVTEVSDLLINSNLKIIGEVKLPVSHCLLTLPEMSHQELKIVYSHPQALAQCREFISRHKLEPRPFYDTAGAAKMLSNSRPEATCVIASSLCAELYNLEIVKEDIQDEQSNFTRFLILSKTGEMMEGNKCSIAFVTKHEAGSLFRVLKNFHDGSINLTRIESRPIKGDPGNYAFLLDFHGSIQDQKITDTLRSVEEAVTMYKFLGCYKKAK